MGLGTWNALEAGTARVEKMRGHKVNMALLIKIILDTGVQFKTLVSIFGH